MSEKRASDINDAIQDLLNFLRAEFGQDTERLLTVVLALPNMRAEIARACHITARFLHTKTK